MQEYRHDEDNRLYYHHSDRLGSGSVITSHRSGDPVHTLAYIPYGETLLDLSGSTGYQTPHQFAGYEKDQESGLSYATAYYYSARRSIFTSVDPMWAKYPYQSGYVYCGNNPMNIIDPDGRDEWEINKQGKIYWIKKSNDHILYAVNANGDRTGALTNVQDRKILDDLSKNSEAESYNSVVSNGKDAFKVFKFAADNSDVEWSLSGFKENGKTMFYLNTEHGTNHAMSGENVYFDSKKMLFNVHSHWQENAEKGGSGYHLDVISINPLKTKLIGYSKSSDGAMSARIYKITGRIMPLYVYHRSSKFLYQYTPFVSNINRGKINSGVTLKNKINP